MVKEQLEKCVIALKDKVSIAHIVADSYYGNLSFINICNDLGLLLISKLQNNAAIYYKYQGKYSGFGRPKIYGDKVDFKNIDKKYLVDDYLKDDIYTTIYQIPAIHKQFKKEINTIIMIKKNIKTEKFAHSIFFSTDLNLSFDCIIKYYSARFQIEFNFRDAKEFFGLEDFMNTTQISVHNAVNLSFFMVNLSHILLKSFRHDQQNPFLSIRDLISAHKAQTYVSHTFKLINKLHPNFLVPISYQDITSLGRIN